MIGQLREIKNSEVELMWAWRNDPNVRKNMYTKHVITWEEHTNWWSKTKDRTDQKYYIYEFESSPCGIVALNSLDLVNLNSSWAFYTAPDAPKGTGSKMEYLLLEKAFNEFNLHKIYCEVISFNKAVISLHMKFGFEEEGIFKDQHIVDGCYFDVHRLAITNFKWSQLRDAYYSKLKAIIERKNK